MAGRLIRLRCGRSNVLLFPQKVKSRPDAGIECHERLGGLLRYYHRKAA